MSAIIRSGKIDLLLMSVMMTWAQEKKSSSSLTFCLAAFFVYIVAVHVTDRSDTEITSILGALSLSDDLSRN